MLAFITWKSISLSGLEYLGMLKGLGFESSVCHCVFFLLFTILIIINCLIMISDNKILDL